MAGRGKNRKPLTERQLRSKALEKEYRMKRTQLRKKGFLTKVNNKAKTTRYQRSQIRSLENVLAGIVQPVKVDRKHAREYKEQGIWRVLNNRVLVPVDTNEKAYVGRGGNIQRKRTTPAGTEIRTLTFPFKVTSMSQVIRRLKSGGDLGIKKGPNEQFAFRLFDHGAHLDRIAEYQARLPNIPSRTIGFGNLEDLANYVELHYRHLFNKENNAMAAAHFELVAFDYGAGHAQIPAGPEPLYSGKGYGINATGRRMKKYRPQPGTYAYGQMLDRDKRYKQQKRKRETEAEANARREKNRVRNAELRAKRKAEAKGE